jgi:heptaprenylglycerol acetyltransferase
MLIQNPKNERLQQMDCKVSPEYSRVQWCLLALLWVVLFPLLVPVAVVLMVLEWTFRISGIATFWICHRLFIGNPAKNDPPQRRQWARAYINNTLAAKLPHWNAPFRRFLFRLTGITIGRGGFIGMGGYMEDYLPENVLLEDDVTVSFGVTFIAHGYKRGVTEGSDKTIILRERCYVGAGSIILPCVEIGSRAVIGAGSVVTKDVPPGAIVAGSPARMLGWAKGFGPDAPGAETEDARQEDRK